jgi:hypothetical protein
MPSASRPTFLRHFGRGSTPRSVPDLADMGTAFALDQSMDQGEDDPYASTSSVVPAPAVTRVAPWRLWLGRKLGA